MAAPAVAEFLRCQDLHIPAYIQREGIHLHNVRPAIPDRGLLVGELDAKAVAALVRHDDERVDRVLQEVLRQACLSAHVQLAPGAGV